MERSWPLFGLCTKLSLVSVAGGDECEVSVEWMICVIDYDNGCGGDEVG